MLYLKELKIFPLLLMSGILLGESQTVRLGSKLKLTKAHLWTMTTLIPSLMQRNNFTQALMSTLHCYLTRNEKDVPVFQQL